MIIQWLIRRKNNPIFWYGENHHKFQWCLSITSFSGKFLTPSLVLSRQTLSNVGRFLLTEQHFPSDFITTGWRDFGADRRERVFLLNTMIQFAGHIFTVP